VSATAGAGKTTAIAGAVLGQSRPVAWLAVDRTDTAPGRLVTYLEAALARAVPGVERVATGAMSAGVHAAEAAGLPAEAVGDAGVVFVLDERERLGEADEAWAVIESLLRYAPDGLRAVLASRRAIPPDVTVLTSGRPRVAEVGETDLRFTEEEAADALGRC
jgi:ATP/maltotriose-dependent transcriptional regulator MalT